MIFSNLCAGHRMVYTMLDNAMPVFVQNFHCLLRPSISFDKRGRSNFALHPKVIHNHLNPSKSLAQFNNTFKKIWQFFCYMNYDERIIFRNIVLSHSVNLALLLYTWFYNLVTSLLVIETAKTSILSCASWHVLIL